MVEALGKRRIYAPPPFILGGRHPVEPGKHPHLAEVYPQIATPQYLVIKQIQAAIRARQSVVVLGIPGVGKSRLCYEMRKTLKLPMTNYFEDSAAPFFSAEAKGEAISTAPFFFDDLEYVAHWRKGFAQAIRDGFQLVFFNPPAYESIFVDFIRVFALEGKVTIFILPSASFTEFQESILSSNKVIHYYVPDDASLSSAKIWRRQEQSLSALSPASIKTLFDLSGGNYGQALEVLEKLGQGKPSPALAKILSGAPSESIKTAEIDKLVSIVNEPSLILSVTSHGFTDYLPLIAEHFQKRPMPSAKFWKKDSETRASILRLLQYGLLTIKEGSIRVRGRLLERELIT